MLMLALALRDSGLTAVRCSLDLRKFKISPSDSNRTAKFENHWELPLPTTDGHFAYRFRSTTPHAVGSMERTHTPARPETNDAADRAISKLVPGKRLMAPCLRNTGRKWGCHEVNRAREGRMQTVEFRKSDGCEFWLACCMVIWFRDSKWDRCRGQGRTSHPHPAPILSHCSIITSTATPSGDYCWSQPPVHNHPPSVPH